MESEQTRVENETHLRNLLQSSRIDAQIKSIVSTDPWIDVVTKESKETDVVFMGLGIPKEGGEQEFLNTFQPLLDRLSTTNLVHSVEKLDVTE